MIVQNECGRKISRKIDLYNLDVIISVGFKKMEDNTLVALTLMIAESKFEDKEMMINVILNLMQKSEP